jgi:hypothetical protein
VDEGAERASVETRQEGVEIPQDRPEEKGMPEICRFFGIIVRMFYNDHGPPHIHAEHQGDKALFDFQGNVLRGGLRSRTARRLLREWIDLHAAELAVDWELARAGRDLNKIDPLD